MVLRAAVERIEFMGEQTVGTRHTVTLQGHDRTDRLVRGWLRSGAEAAGHHPSWASNPSTMGTTWSPGESGPSGSHSSASRTV